LFVRKGGASQKKFLGNTVLDLTIFSVFPGVLFPHLPRVRLRASDAVLALLLFFDKKHVLVVHNSLLPLGCRPKHRSSHHPQVQVGARKRNMLRGAVPLLLRRCRETSG